MCRFKIVEVHLLCANIRFIVWCLKKVSRNIRDIEEALTESTSSGISSSKINPKELTAPSVMEQVTTLMDQKSNEKDGNYFLTLLIEETEKLNALATKTEKDLENSENLPEEMSGLLRAVSGKARLLVRQKMQQFEGLCKKNLTQTPDDRFPTTSGDLQGFWDMINLQLVQLHNAFQEIDDLRRNNWDVAATEVEEALLPKVVAAVKKKPAREAAPGKNKEKLDAMKKAREESRRKMMEEKRNQMKQLKENKNINNDTEVEIFLK